MLFDFSLKMVDNQMFFHWNSLLKAMEITILWNPLERCFPVQKHFVKSIQRKTCYRIILTHVGDIPTATWKCETRTMLTFSNVYFWLASHRESTFPKRAFFDDAELQENELTQKRFLEMMHHKQYFLRNIPSHCQSFPWRCGNISKFGKR